MNQATLLAIETSTPEGSVAVFRDGRLVFSESFQAGRSHSSMLFAALERAMNLVPRFERIAAGLGPGSYAGVRIAISAAIGLELASGAELLGVPSVAALEEGSYLALGDARRESFYFAEVREGECVRGPELVAASELPAALARMPGNLPLFTSEAIPAVPGAQIRFPSAERLGRLALEDRGGSIVARGLLEPIYLRDAHITQSKPVRQPFPPSLP